MDPIYVPLLSALAGAIIGSASSIVTILIQAKIGERRERVRQAAALALEDMKLQIEHSAPGTKVAPISVFLSNQLAILTALEKDDLTPKRVQEIAAKTDALLEVHKQLDRQWRASNKAERPDP